MYWSKVRLRCKCQFFLFSVRKEQRPVWPSNPSRQNKNASPATFQLGVACCTHGAGELAFSAPQGTPSFPGSRKKDCGQASWKFLSRLLWGSFLMRKIASAIYFLRGQIFDCYWLLFILLCWNKPKTIINNCGMNESKVHCCQERIIIISWPTLSFVNENNVHFDQTHV